jgi:hypothetical protein
MEANKLLRRKEAQSAYLTGDAFISKSRRFAPTRIMESGRSNMVDQTDAS